MIYKVVRWVVKFAMAVFFQKIELRHPENVPKQGAVIFVANHPNSIMDALVMGLVTNRKVNYLGHAGLFSNKIKSWFLRSTGVIPVYRKEDAPDKMEHNVSAFDACYEVLENGETIGIFPEGTSDMLRKVKKVKTGAARIALETERRNRYAVGLKIIPIGLYFFSRSRFRSKVLINVGHNVELSKYFKLNKEDNYEAVHQLTSEIQSCLEQLTVNVRNEEFDHFVSDIETLYGDRLLDDTTIFDKPKKGMVIEFVVTQRIAECVEYYSKTRPEIVRKLKEKIDIYKRKLKRLRLRDAMVKNRTTSSQLLKKSAMNFAAVLPGLPIAVYGIINNFVPYSLAEMIAKKFLEERTKILSALLIGGAMVFIFFYTLQVSLAWFLLGKLWALIYLISMPVTGMFALAYLKKIRQQKERLNLSFFIFTNRHLLNKLYRERKKLIAELDGIKEEYLQIINTESLKKV